jgi:hypothetical protein
MIDGELFVTTRDFEGVTYRSKSSGNLLSVEDAIASSSTPGSAVRHAMCSHGAHRHGAHRHGAHRHGAHRHGAHHATCNVQPRG